MAAAQAPGYKDCGSHALGPSPSQAAHIQHPPRLTESSCRMSEPHAYYGIYPTSAKQNLSSTFTRTMASQLRHFTFFPRCCCAQHKRHQLSACRLIEQVMHSELHTRGQGPDHAGSPVSYYSRQASTNLSTGSILSLMLCSYRSSAKANARHALVYVCAGVAHVVAAHKETPYQFPAIWHAKDAFIIGSQRHAGQPILPKADAKHEAAF